MATCDCGSITLGNSGRTDCTNIANATNNLIIVPTYDEAGVKNFIDTTVSLDKAFFDALINQSDSSKRYYPLPSMKNVTSERAEPNKQEFPDGSSIVLQQGNKSFSGEWVGKDASTTFMSKVENYGYSSISAFIIDVDGNIIGNGSVADKLYPIALDGDTWFVNLMDAVMGTSVQMLNLTYQYDRSEEDSNLRMIAASETTPDMRTLSGLKDANAVISAPATTGFTATLTYDYGTQVTKQPIKGLLLADFDCNETSPTPGAEPLASVTEGADGVYAIVYTTPVASADVLSLDLIKDGFEMTTAVITTP